jgi:hypothetical protein
LKGEAVSLNGQQSFLHDEFFNLFVMNGIYPFTISQIEDMKE